MKESVCVCVCVKGIVCMWERWRKCSSQRRREVNILPSISHPDPLTGSFHLRWPWTKVSFSQGSMAAGTNSKPVSKKQCGERPPWLNHFLPHPPFFLSMISANLLPVHTRRYIVPVNQLSYKLCICGSLLWPPQEVHDVQTMNVFRDIPMLHVTTFTAFPPRFCLLSINYGKT